MRLIVTRPPEDAKATAEALAAEGHSAILAPLLEITVRPGADIPTADYQAVLVTSANSVRALASDPAFERLRRSLAVTVGPASATAAREAGYGKVATAEGDLSSLVRWVKQNLAPAEGPLLYASGAVTAGDLEKELGALGYRVRRVVLYEARPVPCLPSAAVEALAGGADGVLLYSPRTAQVWTDLVSQADLREQAARLMHYCLSGNVASVIEGAFGKDCPVAVAAIPEEPALLRLIGKDGSGLAVPSSLP